jgi:hypothetical protein
MDLKRSLLVLVVLLFGRSAWAELSETPRIPEVWGDLLQIEEGMPSRDPFSHQF